MGGVSVSDRTVAVPFLSIAWADLNEHQRTAFAASFEIFLGVAKTLGVRATLPG